MIRYRRIFWLQASHFNSGEEYDAYHSIVAKCPDAPWTDDHFAGLMAVLRNTHGHNFRVSVEVGGDRVSANGWVVDDDMLADLVNEWNNTNLSVLSCFAGNKIRATTENMASVLRDKVLRRFGVKYCRVRINETQDIHADAS